MFIGNSATLLQSLSITQAKAYLFTRFQAPARRAKVSAQEICRFVLDHYHPFDKLQDIQDQPEKVFLVMKKWSSVAISSDDTLTKKKDHQLEDRVMTWFATNNIRQSKCENSLKNKYLVRRASIAMKAWEELTFQSKIVDMKKRNPRFCKLSISV